MDKATELNIKFTDHNEVKKYAQINNKTLLILNDCVLDVTTFTDHHPGGGVLLKNSNLKQIDEQMKFHYPLTLKLANSMIIGSFKKEITKLIDPNKPLLLQIWNLDHQTYLRAINSPAWMFIQSPKLFYYDWMQSISHNKWYTVIPLPFVIMLILLSYVNDWSNFNFFTAILSSILGFLTFTLIEYCVHRFLFHSEQHIPNNRVVRYLHFILHGTHHMLPNDPDRLVLPPLFVLIGAMIGKFTLVKWIPLDDQIMFTFFWGAFLIGYVTYDICHYALHHIDTSNSKDSYFHRLQQYHNQHHFSGEDNGYGVTSKLWDIIFRTELSKKIKS